MNPEEFDRRLPPHAFNLPPKNRNKVWALISKMSYTDALFVVEALSRAFNQRLTAAAFQTVLTAGVPMDYIRALPARYFSYSAAEGEAVAVTIAIHAADIPAEYAHDVLAMNYETAEEVEALYRAGVPSDYLVPCARACLTATQAIEAYEAGIASEYAVPLYRKGEDDSV